ncbi:uncharacterized protein LOC135466686 [Liolophura sinensis]|uniref:uncharacterized protein LOC135466686 n=1 Tax=Liolophura sinensis TaxID=3198878 RepID=UPI0031588A19
MAAEIFYGFELLLLKRFQSDLRLWHEWKLKLLDKAGECFGCIDALEDLGDIPQSLWFLSVALHKRQKYVLQLVYQEVKREQEGRLKKSGDTLLSTYLSYHQFTEFHLDSIFKYGEDNKLPRELFKCPNVTYLSLKYNSLDHLPADIGRMSRLEYLALTNNKLQVHSIPYSLTFCRKLKTVLLDNNLLDALPGFLLKMPSIETVHRHGNHNYFKATFMWYHTDVNFRIIPVSGSNDANMDITETLEFWAAKSLIGSKVDFYSDHGVAVVIKDYISDIYDNFNICNYCNQACLASHSGYKVITFKNPYLGNTCVPFQHWACSIDCAKALEVPARVEQIAAARDLDRQYEDFIQDCQKNFIAYFESSKFCGCGALFREETEEVQEQTTHNCHCTIM